MYSSLSILNTTTEVLLRKALNPQLLPRRRIINGCPLLRVCVQWCVCVCVCTLDGLIMQGTNSEYESPYLAVCHVTFKKKENQTWLEFFYNGQSFRDSV